MPSMSFSIVNPGTLILVVSVVMVMGYWLWRKVTGIQRESMRREASNWHMAEEHMFLDGAPFTVAGVRSEDNEPTP